MFDMADPRFPKGGGANRGNFCPKLHENEKKITLLCGKCDGNTTDTFNSLVFRRHQ